MSLSLFDLTGRKAFFSVTDEDALFEALSQGRIGTAIAENINRLAAGRPLGNVLRPGRSVTSNVERTPT